MASSDLEAARGQIASLQPADAGLDDALSDGRSLQLDLAKEKNRHAEAMRIYDLGKIGQYLGGESVAALTVAFVVVVFGIVACLGCWIMAGFHPDLAEFWAKQAERALAVGMTALSYIFGKSASRTAK